MGRWYLDPCLHANLLNFLLMAMYAWMDYGRGFINSDPSLLNSLYIAFGWAYAVDAALYVSLHEGELPWPSALTMTAEWLNLLGCLMYAATSLLYASAEDDRSSQLAVLMTEALAACVFCAAAVCAAAGWHFESSDSLDKEEVAARLRRPWRDAAAEVLRAPYAWAHVTNFLPAVVYIGSAVAAAEVGYVRLVSHPTAADDFRMPDLLRQLARVYWYGDLLWLLNAVQWLVLWRADRGWEDGGEDGGGDGDGGDAGGASLDSPGTGQREGLLAALRAPLGTPYRALKERRTTPYYVGRPFVRVLHFFIGFCFKRETSAERRAALVQHAAALASEARAARPAASLSPPATPVAKGGDASGGGRLASGRIFTFVAVTALASRAQGASANERALGSERGGRGDLELRGDMELISFQRK